MKKRICTFLLSAFIAVAGVSLITTNYLYAQNPPVNTEDEEEGDEPGGGGSQEMCWKYTDSDPHKSVRACYNKACKTYAYSKPQNLSPQVYCK